MRASRKLENDGLLITKYAGTTLRLELDKVPLWRGDSVSIKQLADDFAQYLYLPRLRDTDVLLAAVRDGVAALTWERETFAYADSYDATRHRYLGLKTGPADQSLTGRDTGQAGGCCSADCSRQSAYVAASREQFHL